VTRPNILVLASDVLFPHFFSEKDQQRLDEVADWTRSSLREDSPALREEIASADVLMTTWHSPFLTTEMFGARPRVKLIAHCGGEVKSRVAEPIFDYVTVTNAADPMARGVAEMTLALVLILVRRIPEYVAEMRNGVIRTNEQVSEGETLRGRTVGIVGFGRRAGCDRGCCDARYPRGSARARPPAGGISAQSVRSRDRTLRLEPRRRLEAPSADPAVARSCCANAFAFSCIVASANGTDRSTIRYLSRIHPNRARMKQWQAKKQTRDSLPKRFDQLRKTGDQSVKEAKDLGRA